MKGGFGMRTDILEKREDILTWIGENRSKAFIAKELNCKQDTLNKYLEQMGIVYKGNQSGKGFSKKTNGMTLIEYLNKSIDIQSNKVRKKLLQEGYKEHRCEKCGQTEWLGRPIPLELHHIDGNKKNNTLENFQLLCPNCHAFTDSYKGKNIAK